MIGNNIKNIREQRGISKAELGKRCATDAAMISRLESGERNLTLDWMGKLANALGCAPWELLPQSWQPTANSIDDTERFFRILRGVNRALHDLHKTSPEEEKLRFVMYLYTEGYAKSDETIAANDNEILRAVKVAWRTA